MPARRTILALALAGSALAGLGMRDWAIDGRRAAAFADGALAEYGLALSVEGSAALSLLPLPRLTLDGVRVTAGPGGPVLAEGGRLAIDLDPLALLAGRAAVGGADLDGARLAREPAAWAGPLARLSERMRAGIAERPFRVGLTRVRLADGPAGADGAPGLAEVTDIAADLAWPRWHAAAELRAGLTWRGVSTRITIAGLRPADLAAGRRSPFAAQADWAGGSLGAQGTITLPEAGAPALAGRARFEASSLPETLAWLGQAAPLAPLAGAFSLEGGFESAGFAASWPSLRVTLGSNVLEGAGSASLGSGAGGRLSLQATLAAETLNLAPLLGVLVALFEEAPPPLAPLPLALAPLTRGDLDLRLSASEGRIGPLQVEDLAASVLVREAAVEVAVNRARLRGGTLKGRVALASGPDPAETEVRAQGGVDRVDLGAVLAELGEGRWLQGPLQAQFSLEGGARDGAGLLARVGGRASLSVENGAISGLDLADVVHRNGAVAPGALARRNGRTAFERASVALRFADGLGEITEASLRGPGIAAALRGQVSLPGRRIDAQADLGLRPPADPGRGMTFAIFGPWEAPDAQPLGRAEGDPGRSGAAGPAVLGPAAAPGLAGGARAYAP